MEFESAITLEPLYLERLAAFKHGELLDRPLVSVHYVPRGIRSSYGQGFYHDRVFGNLVDGIESQIESQRSIWRGGDTAPGHLFLSLGPDELAAFCGAEIGWSEAHPDTNWSIPCVEEWRDFLPLAIREDTAYWKRSIELYTAAADMLPTGWRLSMPDLHSNIDLLAALRDPLRLCLDLVDMPDIIDLLFEQTVEIVKTIHDRLSRAAGLATLPATLQSDFCCLLGPEMFRRWIMPTLEAEAAIVGDSVFHWDGPEAVKHLPDLCSITGIYAVSYVPGAGHGSHVDYIDLYREVQSRDMGVVVSGSVDEIRWMYSQLNPVRTIFSCGVASPDEGLALLEWFEARGVS